MEQAVAKQMEEQAEKEVVKLPETIDGKKVRYILTCVSGSCSDNLPAGILENAAKEGADASQGAALT